MWLRSIPITGNPLDANSGSPAIVVVFEKSSQSLLTLNRSLITIRRLSLPRKQQFVPFALMISFFMIMYFVLLKRSLQARLAEENQLRETVLFDRLDPSLRKGVQIGTPGRQWDRFDISQFDDPIKGRAELTVSVMK
jgi:hypothetical protein